MLLIYKQESQQCSCSDWTTGNAIQYKRGLCNTWGEVRLGCRETCIAEGFHHGALLIGQRVWHLKAEVCRVVNIPRQRAVHRRCGKELHIWVQVVASLPAYQPCMIMDDVPVNIHFCMRCF